MQPQTEVIRRKRILLVEDERAVRDTLRLILLQDSHLVVEANNGAEAFALYLSTKFDLVLTDFLMPFVRGDELAFKIKRIAPHQRIMVLTGHRYEPGWDKRVDAVVSKPFESTHLRATVTRLLAQSAEPHSHPQNSTLSSSDTEVICA